MNAAGRLEEADTVRFEHRSADAATALLAVDVIGAMRMCHAVISHMRRHGHGAIINDDVIRARLRARIGPLARGEGAG